MVIKRGAVWYARIGGVGPPGKKIQTWIRCPAAKTEQEAKREEARLIEKRDGSGAPKPEKERLQEVLCRWLAGTRATVEGSTYETNERNINNHLIPHLGHRILSEITAGDLRQLYSLLIVSGRKDGKGGLSACSIGHCHRLLYQALQQAVDDGLLIKNPAHLVKPPKVEETAVTILDENGAGRLLAAAKGTRLYVPILLAVFTGLRRGEILGLHWEDVDLQRGTLSVRWAASRLNSGTELKRPKSKASRRTVFLPAAARIALEKERVGQSEAALVVRQPDGRPLAPDAFTHAFADLLCRERLPRMRFHDLRHTHVSLLIKYGVDMKAISARLGHSGIGITMDLYGHLLTSVEQDAAARFGSGFQAALSLASKGADNSSRC